MIAGLQRNDSGLALVLGMRGRECNHGKVDIPRRFFAPPINFFFGLNVAQDYRSIILYFLQKNIYFSMNLVCVEYNKFINNVVCSLLSCKKEVLI